MSCSSSTGWNTPSVLPLGMKFTDLKTRDARNISDSFVDFRNETVSEVDYLDLSDSLLRFSSKEAQKNRLNENEEPQIKSNLLSTENSIGSINPRASRIKEFVKKYNINLSQKLTQKTPLSNCKALWGNRKTLCSNRNKMLHYYNLLRGPKEEDEVHADIVKFRRYYNHRPCVSPSALKREANFDFQPIFNLPPSPEEPKSLPLQRIQSPVHEEYESCYFTPVASLEDCADCENKISPRNGEQRRVYVRGDGPTIDDLIKFNNSLPDKATPQKKLSPQYFQPLPYSLRMSCLVAGPDIRADSVTYSHFSDLRGTNQQLLNLPENNFSAECETSASNSCDDAEIEFEESSISGKFSQAVDKKLDSVDIGNSVNDNPTFDQSSSSLDSITEEISFSPDENFIIDESQTTGLNMRVVETSPYKIFTDSSRSSSLFSDYCNEN